MYSSHFVPYLREGFKIYPAKQNRTKGDMKFYTSMVNQIFNYEILNRDTKKGYQNFFQIPISQIEIHALYKS